MGPVHAILPEPRNNFALHQRCSALDNGLLPGLPLRSGEKCADAQIPRVRVYAMIFERRSMELAEDWRRLHHRSFATIALKWTHVGALFRSKRLFGQLAKI